MKKNRILKLFVALAFICSMMTAQFSGINSFAVSKADRLAAHAAKVISQVSEETRTVRDSEKLKKFNGGENYLLVNFAPAGFAIVHVATNQIVEASAYAPSPYEGVKKNNKYYGGVLNYAFKEKGKYYALSPVSDETPLISDEQIARNLEDMAESEAAALAEGVEDIDETQANPFAANAAASQISVKDGESGGGKYIKDYDYIRTMAFGNNTKGTCASVASGILLTFYNQKLNIRTLLPQFAQEKKTASENQSVADYLHSTLISYLDRSGITEGINSFERMTFQGTSRCVKAYTVTRLNAAKEQIDINRPCILEVRENLGGNFWGAKEIVNGQQLYRGHSVVAYGYYGTNMYICHMGWGSQETPAAPNRNYQININWCCNVLYLSVVSL